jgi:glycine reductase
LVRVVHYLNQFFGQIGGEEKADVPPEVVPGAVGPGVLLKELLKDQGEVVATVICGDNYISQNTEEAANQLLDAIEAQEPHAFIAGPAFNAGRYGLACGEICRRVTERLGIPAVTGMFPDNPGAELYKKNLYIIKTTNNASGMRQAMPVMVNLLLKILKGEPIGNPSQEGYIPRGIKKNILTEKMASKRAVNVLLSKIKGEPFETEIVFPERDIVPPAAPIRNLSTAKIALVTEGGLVLKGNPDRLPSARASQYAKYRIKGLARLSPKNFESVHRGFDTKFINEDPNRLVPLDAMRTMEKKGIIKEIFPEYYVTTGVGTTMENGKKIGEGIAKELHEGGISGAIVIAT